MLIIPFLPSFARRKRASVSAPTPPVALTLVSASYQEKEWVRLTFDRAIDISSLDPTQIVIDDDQFSGWKLGGQSGSTLVDPVTVQVPLDRIDNSSEAGVHLFVSATSGIVASDDGGTWAGVSDLALPFP